MRKDVKELADSMQRGWNKAPETCNLYFNNGSYFPHNKPKVDEIFSACAQGHALLGMDTTNISARHDLFPILLSQRISYGVGEFFHMSLEDAINDLVISNDWSTPDVIKWLRSHQND